MRTCAIREDNSGHRAGKDFHWLGPLPDLKQQIMHREPPGDLTAPEGTGSERDQAD